MYVGYSNFILKP